jgi:hypothetical protein
VLGRVPDRDLLCLAPLIEEQGGPLEVPREAVQPIDRGKRSGEYLPRLTLGTIHRRAGDPGLLIRDECALDRLGHAQWLRVARCRGVLRPGDSRGDRQRGQESEGARRIGQPFSRLE